MEIKIEMRGEGKVIRGRSGRKQTSSFSRAQEDLLQRQNSGGGWRRSKGGRWVAQGGKRGLGEELARERGGGTREWKLKTEQASR